MDEIDYIVATLKKYFDDKESFETSDEFLSMLEQYPFLSRLVKEMDNSTNLINALKEYGLSAKAPYKQTEEKMWARVQAGIRAKDKKRKRFNSLWIYAAAACILIGLYTGFGPQWSHDDHSGADETSSMSAKNLFAPGSNRAFMRSQAGTVVDLSENHSVMVKDSQLAYDDGTIAIPKDEWINKDWEFITPKGGQYKIQLDDGTEIWMNADSKLSYPSHFNNSRREVQLTGEAYFEVQHNADHPFTIETPLQKVKVLGTHLNINAYPEEHQSIVSLVEGSVQVSNIGGTGTVLQPHYQSVYDGESNEVKTFEIDDILAWKNGEFMFNDERLDVAMRKLARWYNLDIEVAPDIKDISLWGSVSRYDNFDKIFDLIEITDTQIKLRVEGRKIFVYK